MNKSADPIQSRRDKKRRYRNKLKERRLRNVAILDMETDPFDKQFPNDRIVPFCACLYSDDFEPIIIWEEDEETFVTKIIAAIEALPDEWTIYAHNGGKFDYMFLLHRLRGHVNFKGRSLMSAKVGKHRLRDSFHIIPEKLANWQKDTFDYSKLKRNARNKYKEEIIRYMTNDCKYLLDIVKRFLADFGFKISIGQAAIFELKKHYEVKRIGSGMDEYMRRYYFGGRVECLQGAGHWGGGFKLYDVNSMYPYVMATREHPIGNEYVFRAGNPGPNTCFVELTCENKGGLIQRADNGETIAGNSGRFFTTIFEFETSQKLGLLSNINIRGCIDCLDRSNFSEFVLPRYEKRQTVKRALAELRALGQEDTAAWNDLKKDDIFLKLLLNNAYGKFAQNPRNYKESFITDPDCKPDDEPDTWGFLPVFQASRYWIWERPNMHSRYLNVGTAASITGAARAVLLEAIHKSDDPIYCDTDSLMCRNLDMPIDDAILGSWKLEGELDEVIIAGKKLYAYRQRAKVTVRSKGVAGLDWDDALAVLRGETIPVLAFAPTFTRDGRQFYMERNIKATVKAR